MVTSQDSAKTDSSNRPGGPRDYQHGRSKEQAKESRTKDRQTEVPGRYPEEEEIVHTANDKHRQGNSVEKDHVNNGTSACEEGMPEDFYKKSRGNRTDNQPERDDSLHGHESRYASPSKSSKSHNAIPRAAQEESDRHDHRYHARRNNHSPSKSSSSRQDARVESDVRGNLISNDQFDEYCSLLHHYPLLEIKLQRVVEELKDQKDKLEMVQTESLAKTDRFQPVVDNDLKKLYKSLDKGIVQVTKSLHDIVPSKTKPEQWPKEILWEPFITPVKFSDKRSRRAVLTSLVWKFLVDKIFDQNFACFDGETAEKIDDIYHQLFGNQEDKGSVTETEDSAKWRSSTAQYLNRKLSSEAPHSTAKHPLENELEDMLVNKLGYKNIEKSHQAIVAVIKDARAFKRTLMGQRAIFKWHVPCIKDGREKKEDNEYLANDVEEEGKEEGKIRFVVKPGFIKVGTGTGTNFNDPAAITILIPAFVQLK